MRIRAPCSERGLEEFWRRCNRHLLNGRCDLFWENRFTDYLEPGHPRRRLQSLDLYPKERLEHATRRAAGQSKLRWMGFCAPLIEPTAAALDLLGGRAELLYVLQCGESSRLGGSENDIVTHDFGEFFHLMRPMGSGRFSLAP